jgi:glucose-6-phosphate-specific signal transduction histidine kinase
VAGHGRKHVTLPLDGPNLLRALPWGLAILGIVVPLIASDFAVWPLSLVWLVVLALVALLVRVTRPPRSTRVFYAAVAIPLLFLAGWEGGWWLIPAVVASIAIGIRPTTSPSARHRRTLSER